MATILHQRETHDKPGSPRNNKVTDRDQSIEIEPASPTSIGFPLGATGSIKSQKDPDDASAAGAILGLQVVNANKFMFSSIFNFAVATRVKEDSSSFGSSLLNPSTEGFSCSFSSYRLFPIKNDWLYFGGSGKFCFSWFNLESETADISPYSILFGNINFMFSTKEFNFGGDSDSDNNRWQIVCEIGGGIRGIVGSIDEAILMRLTKGNKKTFIGGELTLSVRLNNLTFPSKISTTI